MDEYLEIGSRFKSSVTRKNHLPYLFLGSGISLRYLGLPTWRALLETFADEIESDFQYIFATHDGDFPKVATEIGNEFHDVWWKSRKFASERAIHKDRVDTKSGALKVAISEYIEQRTPDVFNDDFEIQDDLKEELKLLKEVVVDGVITTNYDCLAEQIFPDYEVYVGQEELLMNNSMFMAEIFKIHGSVKKPSSLILTAEDYAHFGAHNQYLAAKLLTIFVDNPVIFVGYSLNDDYLADILGDLANSVGPDRMEEIGEQIYFVEWKQDPSFKPQMYSTIIERGGVNIPITRIETHSFDWIWKELGKLRRQYPAEFIKSLRESVFNLVTDVERSAREDLVVALPIDSDSVSKKRFVFGIGEFPDIETGSPLTITPRILEREDLVLDVLEVSDEALSPSNVLEFGIPAHIKPTSSQFIPVWKYLKEDGRVGEDGTVDFSNLNPIIKRHAYQVIEISPDDKSRLIRDFGGKFPSAHDVVSHQYRSYFTARALLWVAYENPDRDEIFKIVKEEINSWDQSEKAKLAVALDRLFYAPRSVDIFRIGPSK